VGLSVVTRRCFPALGLLLLIAAADPPPAKQPAAEEPRMTIRGSTLRILPDGDFSYLRFSGGVTAEGEWFTLTADVAELDVLNTQLAGLRDIELPPQARDPQRIVRDPGQTIAEMFGEMELQKKRLAGSELQRIGAAGGVSLVMQRPGAATLTLTTDSLISLDGGKTWAVEQRSRLSYRDPAAGVEGALIADYLVYDDDGNHALARGNISGDARWDDSAPVSFEAQRCEMDLTARLLTISEGLLVRSGSLEMCCGVLSADLDARLLQASGAPRLVDRERGLELTAQTIDIELAADDASEDQDGALITARGGVTASLDAAQLSAEDGVARAAGPIRLNAAELRADRAARTMTATGEPLLTWGDSSYRGQVITLRWEDEQHFVIEVEGPQHARLRLDELREAGADTEQ
jgi:hypothetical protein